MIVDLGYVLRDLFTIVGLLAVVGGAAGWVLSRSRRDNTKRSECD